MSNPLPHLATIRVDGADARDFLHRQLSADINGLSAGESTFACLCQPKGRVIATLLVIADDERVWMYCSEALVEKVVTWLRRFVFRDDVTFVTGTDLDDDQKPPVAQPLPGLGYGDDLPADMRARELAAGVAWLDESTTESFLPQMLGAGAIGALNYRKGCYPGQEIVARTHYLGKLKQRPVLARATAAVDIPAMTAVTLHGANGEIAAQVVDSAADGDGVRLFLVARSQEPAALNEMTWEGGSVELEDIRWPEEPARKAEPGATAGQASATT